MDIEISLPTAVLLQSMFPNTLFTLSPSSLPKGAVLNCFEGPEKRVKPLKSDRLLVALPC